MPRQRRSRQPARAVAAVLDVNRRRVAVQSVPLVAPRSIRILSITQGAAARVAAVNSAGQVLAGLAVLAHPGQAVVVVARCASIPERVVPRRQAEPAVQAAVDSYMSKVSKGDYNGTMEIGDPTLPQRRRGNLAILG